MKIGFYFNDKGFSGLDLQNPRKGNNGIGGTQYCFLMVADALLKKQNIEVIFYHYSTNKLPRGVVDKGVSDWKDMIEKASSDNIDVLVFKPEGNADMIKAFADANLSCVAWAHNYIWDEEEKVLATNSAIRRVVFVSKEQYDRYIDCDIIKKSTYIYNMFDAGEFKRRDFPKEPVVTYTGSLIKAKGFHILAREWKNIIRKVPNAQLYVIGSGQLYDRKMTLGPLGVAEKGYEQLFSKYLTENDELMKSVHFCGNMGIEKLEIYNRTTVGVVNPSARTETFGLSAVEMEACGIPVVTKRGNGFFDTVKNQETGYLVRNRFMLRRRIVELLRDSDKNIRIGLAAREYVNNTFASELLVDKWIDLFGEIVAKKSAGYSHSVLHTVHLFNNCKLLRIVNRSFREKNSKFPSLLSIECAVRRMIRR